MTKDNIPGTRVPDTAIHRASLWLEQMKFGERAFQATEAEPMDEFVKTAFPTSMGDQFTYEELLEATRYYSHNVVVSVPPGVSPATLVATLWTDGFMHGAATVAGKTALSTLEELGAK